MIKWALKLLPLAAKLGGSKLKVAILGVVVTLVTGVATTIWLQGRSIDKLKTEKNQLSFVNEQNQQAIAELQKGNDQWVLLYDQLVDKNKQCLALIGKYQALEIQYDKERQDDKKVISELQKEIDKYPDWANSPIPDSLQRKPKDSN